MLLAAAVLAVWQVGAVAAGGTALASPGATLLRLGVLAGRAEFRAAAVTTAWAFVLAAGLSVGGGLLLGGLLGVGRTAGQVLEPVLASFGAWPKVTLYPVVLLLFGLGLPAQVAMGVMHGLVPVALVTLNATRQVRPVHLQVARTLRLGTADVLRAVVLPSVLPDVLGGVRLGVPLALLGVLIGEMFASRRGLGALAMRAMEVNDGPTLLAIALLLSGFALGVNAGLAAVTGRGRWRGVVPPGPG